MALWRPIIRTRSKTGKRKTSTSAFVPFDPKLGMYQSLGMEYFLEHTNAEYVFPDAYVAGLFGIQPLSRD